MLVLPGLLWAGSLVFLLDNSNIPFAIYLAFGLHFAAKVLIATESGRRFHLDRQSGAMELLMVTPLPARDIVAGQRDALRKQFRPALWLISVVNVVTLVVIFATTLGGPGGMPSVEVFAMLEVFIGGMVMLWLDANALIWLGMWRGLKAKKYPRSVLANLGQVLLIPWIAVLFFALLGGGISEDDAVMLILLWFGLGVVVDVMSIFPAEENLVRSLRSIVSGGNEGR
jgi:hypothetical protein